jgi:hypothetical protein
MLSKLTFIVFKSIKAYGISSILYDPLVNLINSLQIDMITLFGALSIELIFLLLKYSKVRVPEWVEAIEDLI